LSDEQVKRYWGRFKVPVLALHSEKDEFVPEDIDQSLLNQRYKDASPMVSELSGLIPNTGHAVENTEAREWLGERVAQFLESLR
jgi:pimeloyl-ACP methyl ester carboxylesterase